MRYGLVGIAGMIGALLRYFAGMLFPDGKLYSFPLGTLLVNWIGCFLLSWLTLWSTKIIPLPESLRIALTTGLLGSFTTFSTFSVEVVNLLNEGSWLMALIYVLLSLWGGLLFAWSGDRVASRQVRRNGR